MCEDGPWLSSRRLTSAAGGCSVSSGKAAVPSCYRSGVGLVFSITLCRPCGVSFGEEFKQHTPNVHMFLQRKKLVLELKASFFSRQA